MDGLAEIVKENKTARHRSSPAETAVTEFRVRCSLHVLVTVVFGSYIFPRGSYFLRETTPRLSSMGEGPFSLPVFGGAFPAKRLPASNLGTGWCVLYNRDTERHFVNRRSKTAPANRRRAAPSDRA